MTRVLVLDAEAMSSLAQQRGRRFREVQGALEAARRLRREVAVPAVVLAELYRGPRRNQYVDACLARQAGIEVCDTDRTLARFVGSVLAAASAGSEDLVDAHCVAVAVDAGGGVVITGDPDDLGRLASPFPHVQVIGI